jgi:glycosyltransferase involved in cell wall biosynthesis
MKISVSMIVKNEESCLRDCLESVKEADEIIIVDTGSTDKTIEIAKEYTTKIYSGEEYLWKDDFAHSRNQSLELCKGDWILIIDADEVLEEKGISKLKQTIKKTNKECLYFKTISKNLINTHNSIRAFKRSPKIYWKGAIHNYLNITDGEYTDIKLYYGYSDAHLKDQDRALRILSEVVKENPLCHREKFYLAREYYYRQNWKLAIYYYDYYLETSIWAPEMADAWLMKAYCYNNLNENDKAKDCALQAIKINADFKEAFELMGKLSGPKNNKYWKEHSQNCKNNDVLFIR